MAATVLIFFIVTLILPVPDGIGFSPDRILAFAGPGIGISLWAYFVWRKMGAEPALIQTSPFRTRQGRRSLAFWLAFGLAFGLATGLMLGFVLGFAGALTVELTAGLAGGLLLGLMMGFVEVRSPQDHDAAFVTWDPRDIIKREFTTGLTVGLAGGLGGGLAVGFTGGVTGGVTGALAGGLTIWLTGGIAFGGVGIRYLALLLCTRGWFGTPALPWRLGRFLHWCNHAGLVRQAGIGYQFRHRELQDHLAHHPQPAQVNG